MEVAASRVTRKKARFHDHLKPFRLDRLMFADGKQEQGTNGTSKIAAAPGHSLNLLINAELDMLKKSDALSNTEGFNGGRIMGENQEKQKINEIIDQAKMKAEQKKSECETNHLEGYAPWEMKTACELEEFVQSLRQFKVLGKKPEWNTILNELDKVFCTNLTWIGKANGVNTKEPPFGQRLKRFIDILDKLKRANL